MVFYDFPPAFFDPVSIRGYVTNMYTAPAHQGSCNPLLSPSVYRLRPQKATNRGCSFCQPGVSMAEKGRQKPAFFSFSPRCASPARSCDGDMDAELSAFFHKHMADGSMVEWVVEEADKPLPARAVVGGGRHMIEDDSRRGSPPSCWTSAWPRPKSGM